MLRSEFTQIMSLMNDIWGGYGQQIYETWFQLLEKYQASVVRDAIWQMAETVKMKPRIADIVEAMGKCETVGGGSQHVESNGCTLCAGSGWANVEVTPKQMVMMRCMCDRGERLNHSLRSLTTEILRDRYVNVRGEVRLHDQSEEQREAKLMDMTAEQKIAWCKRGMEAMVKRL